MKEIKKEEMKNIEGGTNTVTSSILNAVYRCLNLFFEMGEALGEYIRRKSEDKFCDI